MQNVFDVGRGDEMHYGPCKNGECFQGGVFFIFFFLLIWRELQHEKSLHTFFFNFPLSMEGFPGQIPPL